MIFPPKCVCVVCPEGQYSNRTKVERPHLSKEVSAAKKGTATAMKQADRLPATVTAAKLKGKKAKNKSANTQQ